MHDRVYRLLPQRLQHSGAVVRRHPHQRHIFGNCLSVTRGEVIEHDDLMAGIAERADSVTADVACAAGHENPRHVNVRSSSR
jgi:hypothetical protein